MTRKWRGGVQACLCLQTRAAQLEIEPAGVPSYGGQREEVWGHSEQHQCTEQASITFPFKKKKKTTLHTIGFKICKSYKEAEFS